MRIAVAVVVVFLGLVSAGVSSDGAVRVAAVSPVSIVVTSASDTIAAPVCPDANRCTLRKAIDTANLDTTATTVTISFSATVFPLATPATITVGATPLPVAARPDLVIEGSGAGVRLVSTPAGSPDGLVLNGARSRVSALSIGEFTGVCLKFTGADAVVGGDRTTGSGNDFGDCGTAIRIEGANASVHGNNVGFGVDRLSAAAVQSGIIVTGSNSVVGDVGLGSGYQNRVGNAQTGVIAGGVGSDPVTGIKIVGNVIGQGSDGRVAPVGSAVRVLSPVTSALVAANSLSNAQTGVAVQGSAAGPSAQGVRIIANSFSQIERLSIDLNDDNVANPNDEGDSDMGANGLRNHPRFGRVVQSRVSGTACADCQVQLYLAAHAPGGAIDFGATPIPGGVKQTNFDGSFVFESPAVTPGQWITALATDAQGNTSEFAPGSRVGAGSIQCGNGALSAGWNLAGYFGAEAVNLGASFPAEGVGAGAVRAIYHLEAGAGAYSRWFSDTSIGRTLLSLEPGEAYWFLADGPAPLSGGFSVSGPISVPLKAGWNTIVYIGASAPVADAFASLATNYKELFAWDAPAAGWTAYSADGAPTWAQGFTEAQACRAFQLFSSADALLVPLQP
ncbi:MAG: CSLREA domain-containing protein [Anaerolineaceae bacterium]